MVEKADKFENGCIGVHGSRVVRKRRCVVFLFCNFQGLARNLFWGGVKVFSGRYKTLIFMFN